jgi:DNA-binding FrmR family transcriptional regulator
MDLDELETPSENQETGKSTLETHRHEHHEQVLNRLARIEGHVRAIKRMVEADRSCPEVLVQIAAVRSAINGVGRVILEDHLQNCIWAGFTGIKKLSG